MSKIKYKIARIETDDWKDKCLRSMAELDNFKRRTEQEKQLLTTTTTIRIIEQLLPILDSIDSALKMENCEEIEPIANQIKETFAKLGVTEIPTHEQEFDPNLHNAVLHITDENLGQNVIIEEFAKGYMLNDRVIRHSMVKVAN